MKDKEQQQMQKLQKKGLGVANSSLDPLLAVLVQVNARGNQLALSWEYANFNCMHTCNL
jgi:hypothetical protein